MERLAIDASWLVQRLEEALLVAPPVALGGIEGRLECVRRFVFRSRTRGLPEPSLLAVYLTRSSHGSVKELSRNIPRAPNASSLLVKKLKSLTVSNGD